MQRRHLGFLFGACAALIAGCGSDDGSGRLSLSVTDAPVDSAEAVIVTFTGVELQPMAGERIEFVFDAPREIDLLALQGGLSTPLLDEVEVPAGLYAWIRLRVLSARDSLDSRLVHDDGNTYPLFVPSGAESGLQLHGGLVVGAGSTADFTVDFDLRKSVHDPMGGDEYLLRPTLRLVDNLAVGGIAGTLDAGLLTEGCSPAVYGYAGVVAPDDMGGSGVEPLTSSAVITEVEGAVYHLAFLPAGEYTVAFTCQADADSPDADDDITFTAIGVTTVTADQLTELDLGG